MMDQSSILHFQIQRKLRMEFQLYSSVNFLSYKEIPEISFNSKISIKNQIKYMSKYSI